MQCKKVISMKNYAIMLFEIGSFKNIILHCFDQKLL